eukprot:753509-Hanusia_phi.AAC.7
MAIGPDRFAVGSFGSKATCNGGCILDARMAGQLVEWYGNYQWNLLYSGTRDGFSNSAFQSKMSATVTMVIAYSWHYWNGVPRGTYVFGGYTSQSWLQSAYKRCADSSNGGSGETYACNWWSTCTSDASCASYSQCGCCASCGGTNCYGTCTQTCNCSANSYASLFRLMYDGANVADQYQNSGEGQEIYACSSSGPAFGALGQGGFPPYTEFALNIDISNRSGLVGTYGYTGLGDASWATGLATDWYLDEIEVYGIGSAQPTKGLFQYSPEFVAKRSNTVYIYERNMMSGQNYYTDIWNLSTTIVLPSWAEEFFYGFSVAMFSDTLAVGRRGNRDVYIHRQNFADCSSSNGQYCTSQGAFSQDAWGLFQVIQWPGQYSSSLWRENSCSPYTSCTSVTVPSLRVYEWGCSVSLSADYLIVGAYKSRTVSSIESGAAFLYDKDTSENFQLFKTLIPIDTANQHCGWDVAIDENDIIIGCYGSQLTNGAVAFYNRYPIDCSGNTCIDANGNSDTTEWNWVCNRQATTCTDPPSCTQHQDDRSAGDYFGYSVDISASVAVAGSFGFNSGTGRVYVFEKYLDNVYNGTISSLWQVSKVIDPPVAVPETYFGFQVSLDKSYLLVTDLKTNDGSGYLFSRNYGGLNNWGLMKKLQQPSIGNGPYQYPTNLGQSNSLNYWAEGYGSHQNGAQVQHEVPYYTTNTIVSNSPSPNFGASAKIRGNTALIGAPFADSSQVDIGSVSLIVVHPTSRQSAPRPFETSFTASDVKAGFRYGIR